MSRPASTGYYGDHWRLPTRNLQHMHQPARFGRANRPIKMERSVSAKSHQDCTMTKIEEASNYRYADRILPTLMPVQTSITPELHTAPVTSTFATDIHAGALNSPDTLTNSSNGFSNFPTPTSARSQSAYISPSAYPYPLSNEPVQLDMQSLQSSHGDPETIMSPMDHLVSRTASVSETPATMNMAARSSHPNVDHQLNGDYLSQEYQEPQVIMNEPMLYQNPVPLFQNVYGLGPPTWYTNIKPAETWFGPLPSDRIQDFAG